MRENSPFSIKYSASRLILPPRHGLRRAAGRRAGALFFARHLDYFIVTQNSHPLPGLGTVKTIYRDPRLIVHLPGPDSYREAKNAAPRPFATAQGRLRRQINYCSAALTIRRAVRCYSAGILIYSHLENSSPNLKILFTY